MNRNVSAHGEYGLHRTFQLSASWGPPALVGFAGLCLAVRAFIILIRWDGYEIGKYFFADDAFYYLKIAQNVVSGRGSTFDGTFPTNGYHPLWELCCIVLHAVWPQAGPRMVSLVYVVQTGLLLSAALYLYAGLRGRNAWAAALTVLLLALNTITTHVLVDGMESGLTFTLLSAFAYLAATRAGRFFDLHERGYVVAIGALLLGLSLVRLEAALFSGLFLAAALWRGWQQRGVQLRNGLLLTAALGLCAGAYVAVNLSIAGLPVPVSGLVKALWPAHGDHVARLLYAELGWFVSPLRLQQAFERSSLTALLCLALIWGLANFIRDSLLRKQHGLVLLVGGCVVLIGYNVLYTRQAFHWYGWPALMLGTLGTFGLLSRVLTEIRGTRAQLAAGAVAALAVLYGAGTTYRCATRGYDRLYDWSSSPVLMDTALNFIQTEVPRSASLAGDSVGMLSYMSGRDIMNVEGLVADRAYYDALKRGENRTLLRDRGVTWLFATRPQDEYAFDCARSRHWSLAERSNPEQRASVVGNVQFFQLDYKNCPSP